MGTCKECWSINAKKSRKKHKTSIIKRRFKYNNSERGYFIGMFNNIKQNHKRKKQKNEFKNYEEFYQCWLDQQKIYGRLCPYTGKEMTMIRHTGNKKTISTNISRERILSTRGYSKKNLMFVSWGINNSKGNITPKTAKRYLEIVKERYGTDEMNNDNLIDEQNKKRLFSLINKLPLLYEIVILEIIQKNIINL
jgi:hypothetical protein